jgi:hypothetical protein
MRMVVVIITLVNTPRVPSISNIVPLRCPLFFSETLQADNKQCREVTICFIVWSLEQNSALKIVKRNVLVSCLNAGDLPTCKRRPMPKSMKIAQVSPVRWCRNISQKLWTSLLQDTGFELLQGRRKM